MRRLHDPTIGPTGRADRSDQSNMSNSSNGWTNIVKRLSNCRADDRPDYATEVPQSANKIDVKSRRVKWRHFLVCIKHRLIILLNLKKQMFQNENNAMKRIELTKQRK